MEWRILAMGCRRTIPETAAKVHELDGLYIAAHVDRPNFSVLSALGTIPEPLTRVSDASKWTRWSPSRQTEDIASSSDAVETTASTASDTRYFDAVELSRTADEAIWLPKVEGYAVIRSSDAHNLDDVARVWTEAEGEFSVAGLREVFEKKDTRISPRLTCF